MKSLMSLYALAALAFSSSSVAEDAVCKLVLDAVERSTATPSHGYSVRTMDALNAGKPENTESINTGKDLYLKARDKWQKSLLSPRQVQEQMAENRKDSKTTCHFVRDETVDGVSASLYTVHEDNEDSGSIDSKIWITKSGGLPARIVLDMEGTHNESRYVYGPVNAPAVN
jgi:hypothetical protein